MNTKSKIIWVSIVCFLLCIWAFILFHSYQNAWQQNFSKTDENTWSTLNFSNKIDIEKETQSLTKDEAKQKIENIRKKLALKWLIVKADVHIENQEYTIALAQLLQIYKDIPNDTQTALKIADIYYEMKKFSQAVKYYEMWLESSKIDLKKYIFALFNAKKIEIKEIPSLQNKIEQLPLSAQEKFYYTNALNCIEWFSTCKQNYQDYFNKFKESQNTGTWETLELISELKEIDLAIQNYQNFHIDDLSYKNALISGAFFKNKLYPLAIHTALENISDKPDYRPMLKIIAMSYYEIWEYQEAKKYLIQYSELWDNNPEISYVLGVIYEKLNEHVLSTIHLRKALELWYDDTLDIRKRLLYNYYRLDETDKILSIFSQMIQYNSDELTPDDYSLAIFYHIINDQIETAKDFTQQAIKNFENNETFYGYLGWIDIESFLSHNNNWENIETIEKNTDIMDAEKNINKALELNEKSPMINMIKGKLELAKQKPNNAFIYFKRTVSLDTGWEFEQIAKQELEKIQELKNTQDNQ